MKTAFKIFLGLVVFMLVATFLLFGPTKTKLQSLYLWKADIGKSITWADAYCARKTILNDSPLSKCVRIGKDQVKGKNTMYVFTVVNMYEFENDTNGNWILKHKGPYSE